MSIAFENVGVTESLLFHFQENLSRCKDKIAVRHQHRVITYAELDKQSRRYANTMHALGIGPGEVVGLCFERSIEFVIAILAVLRCGAVYAPIERDNPASRIETMLKTCQIRHFFKTLPEPSDSGIEDEIPAQQGNATVCIIHTSGTTGEPKGVAIPNAGIVRLVKHTNYIRFHQDDKVAHSSNAAFDAIHFEIWGALLNGCELVIIDKETLLSPRELAQCIKDWGITIQFITTALFQSIVAELPTCFANLRCLLFGGEQANLSMIRRYLQHACPKPDNLIHVYGPTECSTFATFFHVKALSDKETLPIGYPISGTEVYVWDEAMRPVKEGVPGEIYLGGVGVANGYYNNLEETQRRFIQHPNGSGMLFRTGDIATLRHDGAIDYLARGDKQVKIRGFRVELNEIEACLTDNPSITSAVVLADKRSDGVLHLTAYFTAQEETVSIETIKSQLSKHLPTYMIPDQIYQVNTIPLTANGKVDESALRIQPSQQAHLGVQEKSQNALESQLMQWCLELLCQTHVDVLIPLQEQGMDSLLLMRLFVRIQSLYQIDITINAIMSAKNIRELAVTIAQSQSKHQEDIHPQPLLVTTKLPLSPSQRNLWLSAAIDPNNSNYIVSLVYRLSGPMDFVRLEQCINRVIERHQALRTYFIRYEGEPYQIILAQMVIAIQSLDFQKPMSLAAKIKSWKALVEEKRQVPFDLSIPPLIEVYRITLEATESILFFKLHHIVVDGWSLSNLFNEINQLYHNPQAGAVLPALPYHYSDYTHWYLNFTKTEEARRQLAFWQNRLANIKSDHRAAQDVQRQVEPHRAHTSRFIIDGTLLTSLREYIIEHHLTLSELFLGAYLLALHQFHEKDSLVIGMPIANRDRLEFENIIGFFVNLLAVPSQWNTSDSLQQFFMHLKQSLQEAFVNQRIPYDEVVSAVHWGRQGVTGLFNILFVMQNVPNSTLAFEGVTIQEERINQSSAKYDLLLSMSDKSDRIDAELEYRIAMYTEQQVQGLTEGFFQFLHALVTDDGQSLAPFSANKPTRTASDIPDIQSVFEAMATPQNRVPALCDEQSEMSYEALNAYANQFARYLQAQGVGAQSIVGIFTNRSSETIVALFALLKLNAIALPLDANYPRDYLAAILTSCDVSFIINTQQDVTRDDLIMTKTTQVFSLQYDALQSYSCDNLDRQAMPNDFLYLIFTSGSTGKPKGIKISRLVMANLVQWQRQDTGMLSSVRTLQFSPMNFDVSFQEIYTTLCSGGSLVLIDEKTRQDDIALLKWIDNHKVQRIFLPYVKLHSLAETAKQIDYYPHTLQEIISTGESLYCTKSLRQFIQRANHPRLYNMYGPSETHVVTWYRLDGAAKDWMDLPPIGYPIRNVHIFILNEQHEVCQPGEMGEIAIAGLFQDNIYLHDHHAERFVSLRVNDQAYLVYRSGDMGWADEKGEIHFSGRNDLQVKIAGFRVDLQQIEAIIHSHPAIRQVAVTTRNHKGGMQLVAHLVPRDAQNFMQAEFVNDIAQQLPHYMVPQQWVVIVALPTTPSGKLDRSALDVSPYVIVPESTAAWCEEISQQLIRIFSDVLALPIVDKHANFFDLGANSLLLSRIYAKAYATLSHEIKLIDFFQYPTIALLSNYLVSKTQTLPVYAKERNTTLPSKQIAIIGVSGKFPEAENIIQFWQNCITETETVKITDIQDFAKSPSKYFVPATSSLSDIYEFDHHYFGITAKEAELMDPQQRHFLMGTVHALEAAGYDPYQFAGKIGLIGCVGENTYYPALVKSHSSKLKAADKFSLALGHEKDFIATKAAYYLNLRGASFTLQAACSSSLTAVHLATNKLRLFESDMMIVGGVLIDTTHLDGYTYQEGHIFSPDGHCRPFDVNAKGTYSANGYGFVVLKRLEDAIRDHDTIYAVIEGSAINNDGNNKVGYSAPSVSGQVDVIQSALENAGIHPDEVGYIEAHGTGTPIGDKIEVTALTEAYRKYTSHSNYCAIASIKSQMGHLGAAAGIVGLIRATLSLHHDMIPPNMNLSLPNPDLQLSTSPFYLNPFSKDWLTQKNKRIAAVSSFGVGGTNAHMIVSEYSELHLMRQTASPQLIVLSAKSEVALRRYRLDLSSYLKQHRYLLLEDIAFTLQIGRTGHAKRIAFITESVNDLIKLLDSNEEGTDKPAQTPLDDIRVAWLQHQTVDWMALHTATPKRIYLPGYRFDTHYFNALKVEQTQSGHSSREDFSDWFYTTTWVRRYFTTMPLPKHRTFVLLMDDLGVANHIATLLLQGKNRVICLFPGKNFQKIANDSYELNIHQPEQYKECLYLISSSVMEFTFVHFASVFLPRPEITQHDIDAMQIVSYNSLIYFMQAYELVFKHRPLEIIGVSNNLFDVTGDETIRAQVALLYGPLLTIPLEYKMVKTRYIDLELETIDAIHPMLAHQICRLFLRSEVPIQAIRGRHYWERQSIRLPYPGQEALHHDMIRKDGVYVITGGLGAIGLTLALHLSRLNKVNLILISRSLSHQEDEWKNAIISQCQQNGSHVEIVACDVAESYQLMKVIHGVISRYSMIHGVIHCAGVMSGGIISLKHPSDAEELFAAKITACLNLEALLKNIDLDFFIHCSSVAAITSEAGQMDYCTANFFLDQFARYQRRRKSRTICTAINWDTWRDVGMAVQTKLAEKYHAYQEDERERGLRCEEGARIFDNALALNVDQIIISTVPLAERQRLSLSSYHDNQERMDREIKDEKSILRELFEHHLGSSIDNDTDFFAAGGDSLSCIGLVGDIHQYLSWNLSIHEFIQHASPNKLYSYIQLRTYQDMSHVVLLKKSESAARLFVIHPVGGDITCYKHFARLSPHASIYAIPDPAIYDLQQVHLSIIEKAVHYLSFIKTIQSHGPFLLAGWSFGALVAHQMAVLLEKENEVVSSLILLDPPSPIASGNRQLLDDFIQVGEKQNSDYLQAIQTICQANIGHMMNHYIREKTYATVELFQADSNPILSLQEAWQSVCHYPLHYHLLAADHYSILEHPQVLRSLSNVSTLPQKAMAN